MHHPVLLEAQELVTLMSSMDSLSSHVSLQSLDCKCWVGKRSLGIGLSKQMRHITCVYKKSETLGEKISFLFTIPVLVHLPSRQIKPS